ncbi:MAG: guanylate kinase [Clostridia bacterium]|nr:guanylate kinase [Clostridia bacterium]
MKQNRKGLLLVVSGPAGVGKGTIDTALIERNPDMKMSISATTRNPRPGEIDGVHYFFKSSEEFERMIENDEFLEYMHVFNTNYYGTPRLFVEEELKSGHDVILEIDVQGAMKIRDSYPDAVLIFIAPPSMSELKARLIGRGTETADAVEKRYATAFDEMRYMDRYDYIVVNNVVDVAVCRVEAIIEAEKCRTVRSEALINRLLGGSEKP